MNKNCIGEKNPAFRHGHACRGKLSSEYTTWATMIARCYNPNHISFKHYGALYEIIQDEDS